jgi:hypothetical protein
MASETVLIGLQVLHVREKQLMGALHRAEALQLSTGLLELLE